MSSFSPLQSKLYDIVLSDRLYVDKSSQFVEFINYLEKIPRLHHANIYSIVRPRGFSLSLATEYIKALLEKDELITLKQSSDLKDQIPCYPVIRLALSKIDALTPNDFSKALIELMQYQLWEHHINTNIGSYQNPKSCFFKLIKKVSQRSNNQAVILIDNYDAPFIMASNMSDKYQQEAIAIYLDTLNAIKLAADSVNWCLLTGHIKFPLANELSEGLPLVKDISYSTVCDTLFGFSQEDLLGTFTPLIKKYAPRHGITTSEFVTALHRCYGGYIFSDRKKTLLSPGSINAVFQNEGNMFPYMAGAELGFLQKALNDVRPDLQWLINKDGQDPIFLDNVPLHPKEKDFGSLLYQLGFLTIDKITRTDAQSHINWRYKYKISNLEAYRTLKILLKAASKELMLSSFNPLVLQDGEHDFDIFDDLYSELLNECYIF